MSRQTSITTPDLVLLALLMEEPLHGYAIVERLREKDASDWVDWSKPQVYYSLRKLAKLQLIIPTDAGKSLGPERVKFEISDSGKTVLLNELRKSTWVHERTPNPFTTWQVLSRWLPASERTKLLERRKLYLKGEKLREEQTLASWKESSSLESNVAKAMVERAILFFDNELAHVENLLAMTRAP